MHWPRRTNVLFHIIVIASLGMHYGKGRFLVTSINITCLPCQFPVFANYIFPKILVSWHYEIETRENLGNFFVANSHPFTSVFSQVFHRFFTGKRKGIFMGFYHENPYQKAMKTLLDTPN